MDEWNKMDDYEKYQFLKQHKIMGNSWELLSKDLMEHVSNYKSKEEEESIKNLIGKDRWVKFEDKHAMWTKLVK